MKIQFDQTSSLSKWTPTRYSPSPSPPLSRNLIHLSGTTHGFPSFYWLAVKIEPGLNWHSTVSHSWGGVSKKTWSQTNIVFEWSHSAEKKICPALFQTKALRRKYGVGNTHPKVFFFFKPSLPEANVSSELLGSRFLMPSLLFWTTFNCVIFSYFGGFVIICWFYLIRLEFSFLVGKSRRFNRPGPFCFWQWLGEMILAQTSHVSSV